MMVAGRKRSTGARSEALERVNMDVKKLAEKGNSVQLLVKGVDATFMNGVRGGGERGERGGEWGGGRAGGGGGGWGAASRGGRGRGPPALRSLFSAPPRR